MRCSCWLLMFLPGLLLAQPVLELALTSIKQLSQAQLFLLWIQRQVMWRELI